MKDHSRQTYQTIIVLALACLVFQFAFEAEFLIYVSAGLLLAGLLSRWLADKIAWVWLKFSEILGAVNGKIILGFVFFLVLTPLSFFYRLAKKDPMQLKRKNGDGTYFITRDHVFVKEDTTKPW